VTYDDKLASQFDYEPAYLPVNRLKIDGTMHDW
jgi:mannonate dehydratase